ncbi:MAG: hypothetical protein K2K53_08805, partial [Oscillospiraceae bacterium]|nr:hypothetical protein [Oscillospiraceae bacterium]
IVIAVAIFIVSGMNHDIFRRQHPGFVPCYTQEEMNRFECRFPLLIAIPVALILLGVLAVVAMSVLPDVVWITEQWGYFCGSLLLFCITIAVTTLVWAGIQHSKYGFSEEKQTPAQRRLGRLWGFGMLASSAVYVGLSLTMDLWDKAWVIYPIAALICAALTVLLKKDDE